MSADTTETGVEHSKKLQQSINLNAPVTAALLPMDCPEGIKARVSPMQSIEPHRILASTRDLNQGPSGQQSNVVASIATTSPMHNYKLIHINCKQRSIY